MLYFASLVIASVLDFQYSLICFHYARQQLVLPAPNDQCGPHQWIHVPAKKRFQVYFSKYFSCKQRGFIFRYLYKFCPPRDFYGTPLLPQQIYVVLYYKRYIFLYTRYILYFTWYMRRTIGQLLHTMQSFFFNMWCLFHEYCIQQNGCLHYKQYCNNMESVFIT